MSGERRGAQPGCQPVVRTTLTLAKDVAIRLDQLQHENGSSFKATVNKVLRAGLDALAYPPPRTEHSVRTEPLPGRLRGRIDHLLW